MKMNLVLNRILQLLKIEKIEKPKSILKLQIERIRSLIYLGRQHIKTEHAQNSSLERTL